jgi:hypothetical protein
MADWSYKPEKFRELILFVADRCAEDGSFGDTHLNKILFFSDAYALQHLGQPITGARYQKLERGPAARALLPVRDELVTGGDAVVEMVGTRRVTRALRKPDMTRFSADEVELVERVIGLFRGEWAVHVSDTSHQLSPGWNLVEVGEDIPLETQLIATAAPSPSVLERGRELAARYGW